MASNIEAVIHCLASEEELQSLSVQEYLVAAFDFDDPEALFSNRSVSYKIRPNSELLSVVNWVSYVNTTHQAPNSVATLFTTTFSSLQRSMDYLISALKNSSSTLHFMAYRQFPSLSYFADTRVSVEMGRSCDL